MTVHQSNKQRLSEMQRAMADFDAEVVQACMVDLFASDAIIRWCHPFGDMIGPDALFDTVYRPILAAWPDLERRDWIVMAGTTEHGDDWVGCGGHYMGTFVQPWLEIRPTGQLCAVRFHEFYRVQNGRIVEAQAIWDIPDVMIQAGVWPLAPSLGRDMLVPGPATQDGLAISSDDGGQGAASRRLVKDMLTAMKRHPREPAEAMEMSRYWHPRMNWYGSGGIGTCRGIEGFRNWHQIPYLNAMPDRGQRVGEVTYHFIGEGNYVGVTGWPNMLQTLTHDGWMGIAPANQPLEMRSLDFWRLENGMIRENWVLIDLLDVFCQLGVDVFARMREFNKGRYGMPNYLGGSR